MKTRNQLTQKLFSKSKKESKESKESAETPELKIKKLKKTNEGIETNESQSSQSEVGCEVKSQTSETSQTSQTSQNSLSSSRSKKLFKRKRTASMMVESSSPGLSVENIYKEAPHSTSVKESNLSSSSSTSPNNVKETKTLGSSQRASHIRRTIYAENPKQFSLSEEYFVFLLQLYFLPRQ